MIKISIRRATLADAASIAAVEVTTWLSAYHCLMPATFLDSLSIEEQTSRWSRSLVKHQHGERKRTLVAETEAGVVGFATAGRDQDEAEVGLVYLLYVLPEYWQCGVGRALMAATMNDLRELGLREAILWVLRDNQRARTFYGTLGWQADGHTRTDDYGGVKLEALCYRRVLV